MSQAAGASSDDMSASFSVSSSDKACNPGTKDWGAGICATVAVRLGFGLTPNRPLLRQRLQPPIAKQLMALVRQTVSLTATG